MKVNSAVSLSSASVADIIRPLFDDGRDHSLAQVRHLVGNQASPTQVSRALIMLVRDGELYRPRRGVYSKVVEENNFLSQTSAKVIPDQRSIAAVPPIAAPRRASLAAPPRAPVFTSSPRRPPVPVRVEHPPPVPQPRRSSQPKVGLQPTTDARGDPYEVPTWIRNTAFLAPIWWLVITGLALILGGQAIGLLVGLGCSMAMIGFYVGTAKCRAKARMSRASTSR